MKRILLAILLVSALAAVAAAQRQPFGRIPWQGRPGTGVNGPLHHGLQPNFITSFLLDDATYEFVESLALDSHGNMYVTASHIAGDWSSSYDAHVIKVTQHGTKQVIATFSTSDPYGFFFLTGLTFDEAGHLYVCVVSWASDLPMGVYRVDLGGKPTLVLPLPETSFPNGITFYRGDMYVTDSTYSGSCGAIWKYGKHDGSAPAAPWYFDCDVSAPGTAGLGPNGIVFDGAVAYVAIYSTSDGGGRVLRLPVRHDGSPGQPSVLVEDPALFEIDGFTLDEAGNLWVVMNTDAIGVITPKGKLSILAESPGWLAYPTQVAFGTTAGTRKTLFLTNGGEFDNDIAGNILSLKVGVSGHP